MDGNDKQNRQRLTAYVYAAVAFETEYEKEMECERKTANQSERVMQFS